MSVVIVCAVFTIFMTLLAVAGIWSAYDMAAHGKVTSARVVEKRSTVKSEAAIVEFTTASGNHVRTKVQDVSEKPGTVIRVKYLPDSPAADVEKLGSHSTALWAGGPAFVGLVSAVLTVGLATGRLVVENNRVVRARRRSAPHWRGGTGEFD